MKNIKEKLIKLLANGYTTPQIAKIAKKIKEPATTIHYNIKKLEEIGAIKSYKAVFDYKKINKGYCTYIMINLNSEKYDDPEKVAKLIAKDDEVESVDICTGEYELIIKLRTENIDEYYIYIKYAVKKYNFKKTVTITSLKQLKNEFVEM